MSDFLKGIADFAAVLLPSGVATFVQLCAAALLLLACIGAIAIKGSAGNMRLVLLVATILAMVSVLILAGQAGSGKDQTLRDVLELVEKSKVDVNGAGSHTRNCATAFGMHPGEPSQKQSDCGQNLDRAETYIKNAEKDLKNAEKLLKRHLNDQ